MNVIDLGECQWKRIANAAAGDFVRVPVEVFANAAQAWRWMLGIVPQTEPVVKRAELLEAMFAPPTDVADIAAVLAALTPPTPAETVTVALPGVGEVEKALILARDLIAVIEQTSNNVWWVNADDPETAVCDTSTAIDKALATVAAANDEGVALDWRAVAKLAGEHGVRYRTNTALEKFLAAIRLLSQGGGK